MIHVAEDGMPQSRGKRIAGSDSAKLGSGPPPAVDPALEAGGKLLPVYRGCTNCVVHLHLETLPHGCFAVYSDRTLGLVLFWLVRSGFHCVVVASAINC